MHTQHSRPCTSIQLVLTAAILVGGCDDTLPPEVVSTRAVLSAAVVSDPAAVPTGSAALSGTASATVAYVSLPPGTVPDGESTTIRNPRTGATRTVPMVDWGFDPVAIEASAGDTLELDVRVAGTGERLLFGMVVPERRPPIVVRTDPPPRKRDVPLNAVMLIVFSEPMAPLTVATESVRLTAAGASVSGTVELGADGLRAVLTPGNPLAAQTDYVLEVGADATDLDGEALAGPVTVEFTTESAPSVAGRLAYFGYMGIYVATADGRFPSRIHQRDLPDGDVHRGLGLSWSPDGGRIAFAVPRIRGPDEPGSGIFIINADGSALTELTRAAGVADDMQPAWSPDGSRIAFVRFGENGSPLAPSQVIHVVMVDGSGLIAVAQDGERPAWSPDSERIAFASREGGIYAVNADGSGLRRLTTDGYDPAWSPDGTTIAFVSQSTGNNEIYVMSADGSGIRRVTDNPTDDMVPTWSPDGGRIAFARGDANGWRDLYVVNADGSAVARLTSTGMAHETHPAWSRAELSSSTLTLQVAPNTYPGEQLDTVFATLRSPFVVQVLRDGQPEPNVAVSWTVTGGRVSSARTTTNASGITSTVATLGGPQPSWLVAEASLPGAAGSPVTFFGASLPATPARVQFDRWWRYDPDRSPLNQDGRALVLSVDTTLKYGVETIDAHGNTVLGVRIDFAVSSGGGSLSASADTTDYWQDGECWYTPNTCGWRSAFTNHRLGNTAGLQSVTATASELAGAPQVTFTAIPVSVIVWYDEPVDVTDWRFSPAQASVPTGATVGWRLWYGTDEHNVTFEDNPAQPVSSGTGGIHTRTFTAPGTYRYRCTLHSTGFTDGEVGVVTVQ